jgi:glycosyltransferase involved in cell wall biosynthesis
VVRPPHVAIDLRITDVPGVERTGLGRYTVEITKSLRRIHPDWRFSLFSNRPELIPGMTADDLRTTRWPTHTAVGRIAWLHIGSLPTIFRERPDVWFTPTYVLPAWWRGPAVVMVHDLVFVLLRGRYRGALNAAHLSAATRLSVHRARRVICPSTETRNAVVSRMGVDGSKVDVIPNGVSDVFFGNVRDSESISGDDPYVLFVGTFEARKGLETLYEAIQRVNVEHRRVRLVLAGRPGWGTKAILRSLERDPAVEMVLDPPDALLRKLYQGALALAFPSRMEGFGLPVAEALAAGCPVIASDLDCIREFAGDFPRYFPPGDAEQLETHIDELLATSGPELSSLREDGQRKVAGLRWDVVAERTAESIERAAC